jgi:hypothetical protein
VARTERINEELAAEREAKKARQQNKGSKEGVYTLGEGVYKGVYRCLGGYVAVCKGVYIRWGGVTEELEAEREAKKAKAAKQR